LAINNLMMMMMSIIYFFSQPAFFVFCFSLSLFFPVNIILFVTNKQNSLDQDGRGCNGRWTLGSHHVSFGQWWQSSGQCSGRCRCCRGIYLRTDCGQNINKDYDDDDIITNMRRGKKEGRHNNNNGRTNERLTPCRRRRRLPGVFTHPNNTNNNIIIMYTVSTDDPGFSLVIFVAHSSNTHTWSMMILV
jgi:hypothetical protein